MELKTKFGPAGNEDAFFKTYKSSVDAPKYLASLGLTAYEYQCGRGVNISQATAAALGAEAKKHGIEISLHSPYYISMSGADPEKRLKSIDYILQSARAVSWMGGGRVIVHSGSVGKGVSREAALALAKDTLKKALDTLDAEGLDVTICMETMGKINQLGTLDEVLSLCSLDERVFPCIDFGHLNARTHGGIKTMRDYEDILDRVDNLLGSFRAKNFHVHFSKIEYSAGGEVRHLRLDNQIFGPDFEPLAELIAKRNLSLTVICESDGTQASDAKLMRQIAQKACQSL